MRDGERTKRTKDPRERSNDHNAPEEAITYLAPDEAEPSGIVGGVLRKAGENPVDY
jgi:hypothetical protein